jgi:hypothetical protein
MIYRSKTGEPLGEKEFEMFHLGAAMATAITNGDQATVELIKNYLRMKQEWRDTK